jgi:hypothetical protein
LSCPSQCRAFHAGRGPGVFDCQQTLTIYGTLDSLGTPLPGNDGRYTVTFAGTRQYGPTTGTGQADIQP